MPVVNYDWDELEDNIVEEYDDAGAAIADYTTEPDHFGNVISQHRGGQTSFFHYDGQGSTLAVTDASQTVTDTRAYSAFGETTETSGSTSFSLQHLGEHGYHRNLLTGEYATRYRNYLPQRIRWLSPDPLGYIDGPNLYVFVRNSPNGAVDLSGLSIVDPIMWWYMLKADEEKLSKEELTDMKANCKCIPVPATPVEIANAEAQSLAFIWCNSGVPEIRYSDPRKVVGIDADKYNKCDFDDCIEVHEKYHLLQFASLCPDVCKGQPDPDPAKGCLVPTFVGLVGRLMCGRASECYPTMAELRCWKKKIKNFKEDANAACIEEVKWMVYNAILNLAKYGCTPDLAKEPELEALIKEVNEEFGKPSTKRRPPIHPF